MPLKGEVMVCSWSPVVVARHWADGGAGVFPDWVQINFNGQKTLDHVVVYSVQDNFLNPVEPTDTIKLSMINTLQ